MSQVDPNNNSMKFILSQEEEKPNLWNLWNLFGSRKVHRLSLENCTSISIRAEKINDLVNKNQTLTEFQISSTPWWLFFDCVPVKLGNDIFNVNISSCAKKLGISKKEVVELAKKELLEQRITNLQKSFETELLTKIGNFLNNNHMYKSLSEIDKKTLKEFIQRNVGDILSNKDKQSHLIDDGTKPYFKIKIENKRICLGFPLHSNNFKETNTIPIVYVYHHIQ
jgi:hypothetical protein